MRACLRPLRFVAVLLLSLVVATTGLLDLATDCGLEIANQSGGVCVHAHGEPGSEPSPAGSPAHHDSVHCACACHLVSIPSTASRFVTPGSGCQHHHTLVAALCDCTQPPILRPPIL